MLEKSSKPTANNRGGGVNSNKTVSKKLAACPTRPAVVVKQATIEEDEDDDYSYGADSQESFAENGSQEDLNGDYNEDEETTSPELNMTEEEKAAEAKIQWDTVDYHFDHEFDLADLVSDSNKGLKLENDGSLKLSVENGFLEMGYRSHGPDFIESEDLSHNSDIVKSIHIEGLKITGWEDRILVSLATVPKFSEEGHYANSKNVNQFIYPHEWKDTRKSIEIINRGITNSMMNFQKKYPGISPENLARDIKKSDMNNFLVKLSSPVVSMINNDKAADNDLGTYTQPDLVKTNQVLIPKEIVRVYRAKTLDLMRKGVSYANITDNRFSISFEVPIPSFLKAKHEEWKTSKYETGRQFLAFADTGYKNRLALGSQVSENPKTKALLFKDPASRFIRVQGKVVIRYKKMNQAVIKDL